MEERPFTYTYDAQNRLASAQNAGSDCTQLIADGKTKFWGNSYVSDGWGELLQRSVTKCSSESLPLISNTHNRPDSGSTPNYGFDAAGNMTFGATTSQYYTYDDENKLTSAGGFTYTYDGGNSRVKKTNGSTGTLYWYGVPGVLAESDLAGNIQSEYVFFGGKRVARRDNTGQVFYYFSDHLGSTSVITDAAGNLQSESEYYPWGGERRVGGSDDRR